MLGSDFEQDNAAPSTLLQQPARKAAAACHSSALLLSATAKIDMKAQ
jgi:hypothetical protein